MSPWLHLRDSPPEMKIDTPWIVLLLGWIKSKEGVGEGIFYHLTCCDIVVDEINEWDEGRIRELINWNAFFVGLVSAPWRGRKLMDIDNNPPIRVRIFIIHQEVKWSDSRALTTMMSMIIDGGFVEEQRSALTRQEEDEDIYCFRKLQSFEIFNSLPGNGMEQ